MSEDHGDDESRKGNRGDYEVGYCRPPVHSRRKKGDPSLNPSGRPRKPRSVIGKLDRALSRRITVVENGVRRRQTMEEAGWNSLALQVAQDDLKAMAFVSRLRATYRDSADAAQVDLAAEDLAILEGFLNKQARRSHGEAPSDPPEEQQTAAAAPDMFDGENGS